MNAQPASSAPKHAELPRARGKRKSASQYMSDQQIQAYLAARDTLRRARQASATAREQGGASHDPWPLQTRH